MAQLSKAVWTLSHKIRGNDRKSILQCNNLEEDSAFDKFFRSGWHEMSPSSNAFAFIDAIRHNFIVKDQYNITGQCGRKKSLIGFGDVNFSYDISKCWEASAFGERMKASCTIANWVGIIKLNR